MAIPSLDVPMAAMTPRVAADADDPAWRSAATILGFSLALGAPATDEPLPTRAELLWDRSWLYVRFVCLGPEPYAPYGQSRDAFHSRGDVVEVFMDPVGDGRQYFEIQQSPAGGILDQNTVLSAAAECDARGRLLPAVLQRDYWPSLCYDMAGLRNASRVQAAGEQHEWIADFAFPAKAVLQRLGVERFSPMALRMNLVRYHYTGKLEEAGRRLIAMNWSPVVFGCPHQSPGAMGAIYLVGM